ncbi:MAG: hypothetical protein ACP5DQ_10665 [Bacteroidales bacterium]
MNSIDKIIEKIKQSFLFYLFLSSKELFHTNFWFWLSILNPQETIKLFSDKNINGNLTFKREHNQSNGKQRSKVDLLISSNNVPCVVIENKIKDFPKVEQLLRIKNSFDKIIPDFILATLFWTEDFVLNGWNVRTYKDISNKIEPNKFTEIRYYKDLIYDYKQFTKSLASLSELLEINDKYDFAISFKKDLYNKLNEIKLWEGYQKLRASHLLYHFNSTNIHHLKTNYSIHHQKATIDFEMNLKNEYKLGIEIEDNQYRKYVKGHHAKQFAENLIKNNIFLFAIKERKNKPYLNYGEHFKYQYDKIEKIPFSNLFDRINNEFSDIKIIIDKIEKQIP